MIHIALVGYGKMGRRIETLIREDGQLSKDFVIAKIIKSHEELFESDLKNLLAIDFSSPKTILKNITYYVDNEIRVVVGTTGWLSEIERVRRRVLEKKGSFLYGENFSVGVHLFLRVMRSSLELMKDQEAYHLFLREVHHRHKKDSPSGTGYKMINLVKELWSNKKVLFGIGDGGLGMDEISMVSQRGGEVVGFHEAIFDSAFDSITLSHNAKTRDGFCYGALECAKWLSKREGFFGVEDYLDDKLGGEK